MGTVPEVLERQQLEPERPRVPWSLTDMALATTGGLVLAFGLVVLTALSFRAFRAVPPAGVQTLLFSVYTYGALALSVWYFVLRRHGASWGALGFGHARGGGVLATLGAVVGVVPVVLVGLLMVEALVAALLAVLLGDFTNPQQEAIAPNGVFAFRDYVPLLIAAAVVAPVVEELLFRGMLYRYLRSRMGMWPAVLLSAALFAVAHVIPVLLPVLFITGIALALLAEYSRSIYPSIALHALHNAVALTALYYGLQATG
ncbi:MAG: CPBP family intramembrane metalloprotease [Chloroflexota bacterium]|nr:CPBP family intramembrane metalloprotease [Chloroflexota bacterium]